MSDAPADKPSIDAPDLRVLLVGRSEIERSLRRDPSLEILRARTAMDAIGELSLCAAERDGGPTCVLLAPGVVDATREADWLGAMRSLDAHARFLSLGEGDRPGFDARIDHAARPEDLRRLAMGAPPAAATASAAPALRPSDAPDPTTQTETESKPSPGPPPTPDASLAEAVLRGESVAERAVALLRTRFGLEEASYSPGSTPPAATPQQAASPVERAGVRLGWLVGPADRIDSLGEAAAWLAPWLALEAQRRQLQEAAFTDELTGAWNRRYFTRFLSQALEDARRRRRDVTLMVYDIDDFKRYNDAFGHAAGDEILRETVRLLRSVIRPTDRVCRIGGDEFAVVFDDPSGPRTGEGRHPTSIGEIAERFQRQVCEHRFPKLGQDAEATLTISGGLATFPWDGHDASSLVERADQLALESKRQGKNVLTLGPGAERVCRVRFGDPPGEEA